MSSDDDSISEWTLDEIDLDKPLVDLHLLIDNRTKLHDALFEHLNKDEIEEIFNLSNNEVKKFLPIVVFLYLCEL